jgi:hypothetical protein
VSRPATLRSSTTTTDWVFARRGVMHRVSTQVRYPPVLLCQALERLLAGLAALDLPADRLLKPLQWVTLQVVPSLPSIAAPSLSDSVG